MRKISVVMASYLGEYGHSAKNRDQKYIRAVKSFLNQTYPEKELIIVADGCQKTQDIYEQNWKDIPSVKCFLSPKQQMYSGDIRNIGNKIALGELISYLDNDDVIGKTHLETIESQFTDEFDWVYYNDYLVLDKSFKTLMMRDVEPRFGSIGTSSITHKRVQEDIWFTGYGHDWLCVLKLAALGGKFKKLERIPQYLVAHWGTGEQGITTGQGGDF